jgi:uncharacterized membrane protein
MTYLAVKWLHILSSTVLFGTGLGSAYYMYFACRTRDAHVAVSVIRRVVIADWTFTTPTVVLQPATGYWLMYLAGFPFSTPWIYWSIVLYLVAGAAWLPVVWMQIRMRELASTAAQSNTELPPAFWRMLNIWTSLGVVAFLALVVVFYLMVAKPEL